ncbi:DUF503 domain-containing protein [bacterium]|nr:DUF503 domain-containing protein [bacterium]
MIIGFLGLEIYLPQAYSLKEKRKRMNKLRDRLKSKYNVAFAELDYQNKWQRAKIGMVTLNSQKKIVGNLFDRIIEDIENILDGEIIDEQIHYL